MNVVRKAIVVASALLVSIAAGNALAQNIKYFSLGAPSSAVVTATTIQVTFKNLESGNSSFNSIGIKGVTSGGMTLSIVSATASPGGPGTQLSLGDGYLYLTGLAPVKKGQTLTVTVTVAMSGGSCSTSGITWSGRAFTGSPSQPSTEFQTSGANPQTSVSMACTYGITGSVPSSITRGAPPVSLAIAVTNAASSAAAITSVGLTPPTGVTASGSPYAVSIGPGSSGVISVNAVAGCAAASGGSWTSAVAGFTRTGSEPATAVGGACSLAFTGTPTSVVAGVPFTMGVSVRDGAGNVIPGYTGNVTLVLTGSGCSILGTNPVSATGGSAGFLVTLDTDAGTATCSLKATATVDGAPFESPLLTLKVFDGVLGCNASVPPFDALDLPASGPGSFTDPTSPAGTAGYVTGMRGAGNDKLDSTCTNINYAIYNNIATPDSGASIVDPAGNVVPPGYFSFSWDLSQALNPVVALLTTYRSEWGDAATGLPVRQTKVCSKAPLPCTSPADYQVAPACLGSLIERASIPPGESACLAYESWRVVPIGDAEYCSETPPLPPANPPPGWAPRCLQASSIAIFGKDPVFGR